MLSRSVVSDSVTPWTVAHQALLFVGFTRQEYWSGFPFSPPGDLLDPRIEPAYRGAPALAGRFFLPLSQLGSLEKLEKTRKQKLHQFLERNSVMPNVLFWPSEIYTSELWNWNLMHWCCF